ncbi:MAG: DNA mismatch repair endonuclease MutL [Chitinophagaceae bacterium]|nr:MAG: DNA mismatch repair endonuclease MutL [Chitinophagaceae bacterium]
MSDIVKLLPDAIANQIAAGEVIQRPASVVKELMENAIDAGCSEIKLNIRDAGKTLIQLIDDGSGMSHTDARLALSRHATSKIRKAEDLFSIRTMGFRGEALASIVAISKVEIKTRLQDEELGTLLRVEGSEISAHESCQCKHGTTFSVKNLFYNIPARRNFLKSDPVETRHIIDEFQRIALAYPNIQFQMTHNEKDVFSLPKGNLKQRIVNIFGKNYREKIFPVQEDTEILKINGYIGKPDFVKKTRGEQFIFVNNRFIKSGYINHAIQTAYDKLIPEGSFSFFCLFLELDPSKIDVNVHPTKQEIKFEDERVIYQIINASIRKSLTQFGAMPSLDFDVDSRFRHLPGFQNQSPKSSDAGSQQNISAFPKKTPQEKENIRNWATAYRDLNTDTENEASKIISSSLSFETRNEQTGHESRPVESIEMPKTFQLHKKYVISSISSGLIIINQEYAHQRILFEKYIERFDLNQTSSQRLVFPENIELSAGDYSLIEDLLEDLNTLGFDIEKFGKNTLILHGVPSEIRSTEGSNLIHELLELYKISASGKKQEKYILLARCLSKQLGIKAGRKLKEEEMQKLIDELFACKEPGISPERKKTYICLDSDELENRFNH